MASLTLLLGILLEVDVVSTIRFQISDSPGTGEARQGSFKLRFLAFGM